MSAYDLRMSCEVARSVLVVDDDAEMLRVVRESIRAFLRWEVVTTVDPIYGFELALRQRFDLYVFDYAMQPIQGDILYNLLATVFRLRLEGEGWMPPVLLMTAHGDEKRVRELAAMPGVRGVLGKPFQVQRLIERLAECCGG